MLRPDWRNAADYEPLRDADTATLAGEFLKRNPDYIADNKRLTKLDKLHALTPADRDAFAAAWGLRFRAGRQALGLDGACSPDRGRRRQDATGPHRAASPD